MSEELPFRIYSVPCYDFEDEKGEKHRVTAIIAPINIRRSGDGWEISWACSRALACQCRTCRYSKAAYKDTAEERLK